MNLKERFDAEVGVGPTHRPVSDRVVGGRHRLRVRRGVAAVAVVALAGAGVGGSWAVQRASAPEPVSRPGEVLSWESERCATGAEANSTRWGREVFLTTDGVGLCVGKGWTAAEVLSDPPGWRPGTVAVRLTKPGERREHLRILQFQETSEYTRTFGEDAVPGAIGLAEWTQLFGAPRYADLASSELFDTASIRAASGELVPGEGVRVLSQRTLPGVRSSDASKGRRTFIVSQLRLADGTQAWAASERIVDQDGTQVGGNDVVRAVDLPQVRSLDQWEAMVRYQNEPREAADATIVSAENLDDLDGAW